MKTGFVKMFYFSLLLENNTKKKIKKVYPLLTFMQVGSLKLMG